MTEKLPHPEMQRKGKVDRIAPLGSRRKVRHSPPMATYLYETTDPDQPVRHYEIQQSMKDSPLTVHPETGEPIRRVITGGFGYISSGNAPRHADMQRSMGGGKSGGGCGTGCGCH